LLGWYDRHARVLPWRVGPRARERGVTPDPYRVWLSEVMLQQTTVAAVRAYFETFTTRWPTVEDLAAAETDDVMRAWAGLGYYARARRLKACADVVANDLKGVFPQTVAGLEALPGLGPYTAAAIAAIAFDVPAAVVDGNVERVIARLDAIDTPLTAAKALVRARQAELTPQKRPGDYAQAVMDLGATICTPKKPACVLCPWSGGCVARARGTQLDYPVKPARKKRPQRYGHAFVVTRDDGAVLLRRRPPRGLLGGMAEPPGTDWTDQPQPHVPAYPIDASWRRVVSPVQHVFTHFALELTVWLGQTTRRTPPDGYWWAPARDLPHEALPSVFRKVIEAGLPGATKRPRKPPAV